MGRAVILDAVRSPRGRGKRDKGALGGIHPQEVLAQTLNALAKRTGISVGDVDDVVIGCVSQVGEQGVNIARNAVLAAGWPQEVTGVSVNRFCSSGLQSVAMAAYGAASGYQQLVVAGGVESMSRVPMGSDGGGQDGANLRLRKRVFQVPQGISADLIATREKISRRELDAFSLASQRKAALAIEERRFERSLVSIQDPERGTPLLTHDQGPRPDTTLEGLLSLPPSFADVGRKPLPDEGRSLDEIALSYYPETRAIEHVHTAGNSSGLADGAAAVLVASEEYARTQGLKPRARVRAVATVGSDPVLMLTGPAPASLRALKLAGMTASDIDLWEINEAFAVVPLQTIRALGIDPDRVNVNGGAIALGHPLGATGAMLLGTLLDELERTDRATGLVTLCIGGGQGIAMIIERV
ncbi:MAG: acetyl-CoA C-acetyltransferase [Myxococcaceae bacterium]